jgi:glycosidase
MPVNVEPIAPHQLNSEDFSLEPRGRVYPSPCGWRDQILYFLLPDRFSDGNESQRPLFDGTAPERFHARDRRAWMEGGRRFQGGTINGIRSKLDYLQGLGVTTLWLGPVWKQRPDLDTYHGYGIQNFLDIDPRFGTRQDLRNLIDAAHDRGMYVLLDAIYNHTGNNWFYRVNGTPQPAVPYRFQPPYPVAGWHSRTGECVPDINRSMFDDGVWPAEFQNTDWYNRAGSIGNWDPLPGESILDPNAEFRRGDFFDMKDLALDKDEVLSGVINVYQYWIALTDCDGFRIDAVKHVPGEASRRFSGAIHEYAESIGKENFLLLGEVTGGDEMARDYLEILGLNIDAVLDIGVPTSILAGMVKGFTPPSDFFNQFIADGQRILSSHRETGRYHVSILDDHDMVGRTKDRFAAHNNTPYRYQQVAHAVGTQLTTLGTPCIYYGTEQAFDGTQDRQDPQIDPGFEDRYIRESMFGGTFGAFETNGCHFFDSNNPAYLRIAAIAQIRNRRNDQIGGALRRGRQYLRETSIQGRPFSIPGTGELIAWSRILFNQEVLIVLNTNGTQNRSADIAVHGPFHIANPRMTFLYNSAWSDAELRNPPADQTVPLDTPRDGRMAARIALPPAGMAILA